MKTGRKDLAQECYKKISAKEKANKWWRAMSINEMKALTAKHPYYKHFDSLYVNQIKHGFVDMYRYFVLNEKD